jgi:lipopolysaccharide/colanic/teichoic acid biosynthesis glycosyltransferase
MRRVVSFTVALGALALLSPLLLLVAVVVRVAIGTPVLFVQTRPGLRGVPFRLIKFRTMTEARDEGGTLLPDRARLTTIGRFLRATSLDELPELWNIIRGDMGWVGPRPLLMEYLPLYDARQARRHDVKPGLTGWAQVNGRNALSWEEKFELDLWYVHARSWWLDCKIMCTTVARVVRPAGIGALADATTPRFQGSRLSEHR